MADLIDRESAIYAIMSEPPDAHYPSWYADKIKSIPAVAAVPVVRNDLYQGLKQKYVVLKARTGELVRSCFVLRPDKDPAAVAALRAYARYTDNKTLANDIINWVGEEEEIK